MTSKHALCLAILACMTMPAAAAAPDAIYRHGKVVTVDGSRVAQAFAVRGDRFVAVGSDAQVMRLAGKTTRVVDLGGATVIPGLADSHDHLWNSAKFEFRGVDMIGVKTLAEMQARLRAAVAKAAPGETVFTSLGWAIRPTPAKADLDAVSANTPIVVLASRHATGMVNSAALVKLGISKANPLFQGAKVPVDKDGEPTGAPPDYPGSLSMADALLPPLTPEVEESIVQKAMAERNALGITSTRELALWPQGVAVLTRLRQAGKLTLRMALGLEYPDQAGTMESIKSLPRPKRRDAFLFIDAIGEEPWTPGTMSLAPYTDLLRTEARLGWRPAPHVSADAVRGISFDQATDQTLTAYESVDREHKLKGKRWYIEHVPFATPDEIARLARLGAVVSVQFQGYEPPVPAPLPPERMAQENPIRSLLDHGLVVIGGSDYTSPTAEEKTPNNPMIPFYFYVTRKTKSGAVLAADQKISREDALKIFTVNPAFATFQEKTKGRIKSGMLADFVILNQDLMTVPDDQILATKPQATFVGGRQVYAAPGTAF